jgi:hypothetical protein
MSSRRTPTHMFARRELVRSIIELANSHLAGGISLVSVDESEPITTIEFERTYPLRDVPRPDGRLYETARFEVSVTETVAERNTDE